MMEDRLTLVIPNRACAQILKPLGQPGYVHTLSVKPCFRRRGYGLELLKFALQHTREFLELDILRQSKVMQRNAWRIGYRKCEQASERYIGCDLWRRERNAPRLPESRLRVLRAVHYRRKDGETVVLYLSNCLDESRDESGKW